MWVGWGVESGNKEAELIVVIGFGNGFCGNQSGVTGRYVEESRPFPPVVVIHASSMPPEDIRWYGIAD